MDFAVAGFRVTIARVEPAERTGPQPKLTYRTIEERVEQARHEALMAFLTSPSTLLKL